MLKSGAIKSTQNFQFFFFFVSCLDAILMLYNLDNKSTNAEISFFLSPRIDKQGFPMWLSGKEYGCKCRRCEFDPWVGKIP